MPKIATHSTQLFFFFFKAGIIREFGDQIQMGFGLFTCAAPSSVGWGATETGWLAGLEREDVATRSVNVEPGALLGQTQPTLR